MEKNQKYIAIVKQLENKKFLIKFPDFEGISSVAEKEESIEKVAGGMLNTKIQELKDEKIELPVPMGIVQVQKLLQEGEFTVFVSPKNISKPIIDKENLKNTFDTLRDKSFKENVEKIYSKSEEVIKDKIGNNVKERITILLVQQEEFYLLFRLFFLLWVPMFLFWKYQNRIFQPFRIRSLQ